MSSNKRKVLITGASGFIGTNLVQLLLEKDFEILNIDIVPPKNHNHNKYWHQLDILDYYKLEIAIQDYKPDYIVHLAALADFSGKSLNDYAVNTDGTENICKILSTNPNKVIKVIFTSSMLVCKTGYIPKTNDDYCSSTFYGESKIIGEKIVKEYSNKLPPWVIVRPTSIWGPWFGEPYKNFFDVVINRKFFFPKKKACVKTYGYVENIINQIYMILLDASELSKYETFYLGDNPPINVAIWADEVSEIIGIPKNREIPFLLLYCAALFGNMLKIIGINFPMTTFRLRNMTTNNILSLEKTERIAGKSLIDRKEGIIRTINWMNIHKK